MLPTEPLKIERRRLEVVRVVSGVAAGGGELCI
jgi:hypothetical protein